MFVARHPEPKAKDPSLCLPSERTRFSRTFKNRRGAPSAELALSKAKVRRPAFALPAASRTCYPADLPPSEKNQLYYGDNLDVLRRYIADASVDLIYLDPPFNSRQDYNVLFAEKGGSQSSSQIRAFEDTWEWNTDA